ncbi:MAG: hypothetical protein BWY57_02245 [Betaproteobacteria bacterium ADurb.Bin341]|nr:MAG: hypothetical protein BWY57_02245 [Betaproteobacteria bacterium ADurb.Bin341]
MHVEFTQIRAVLGLIDVSHRPCTQVDTRDLVFVTLGTQRVRAQPVGLERHPVGEHDQQFVKINIRVFRDQRLEFQIAESGEFPYGLGVALFAALQQRGHAGHKRFGLFEIVAPVLVGAGLGLENVTDRTHQRLGRRDRHQRLLRFGGLALTRLLAQRRHILPLAAGCAGPRQVNRLTARCFHRRLEVVAAIVVEIEQIDLVLADRQIDAPLAVGRPVQTVVHDHLTAVDIKRAAIVRRDGELMGASNLDIQHAGKLDVPGITVLLVAHRGDRADRAGPHLFAVTDQRHGAQLA